jgi:hypothetical protein
LCFHFPFLPCMLPVYLGVPLHFFFIKFITYQKMVIGSNVSSPPINKVEDGSWVEIYVDA